MSWSGKSQIPLDQPNSCTPETGSAAGKPWREWPSGGQCWTGSHQRVPETQQAKTHPCSATEVSCSKTFASGGCGEEMSFLPPRLGSPGSLAYVCAYVSPCQKSYDAALQLELFQQPPLHNNVHFSKPLTPCFSIFPLFVPDDFPAFFSCPCPTPSSSFSLHTRTRLGSRDSSSSAPTA